MKLFLEYLKYHIKSIGMFLGFRDIHRGISSVPSAARALFSTGRSCVCFWQRLSVSVIIQNFAENTGNWNI